MPVFGVDANDRPRKGKNLTESRQHTRVDDPRRRHDKRRCQQRQSKEQKQYANDRLVLRKSFFHDSSI